MYRRNNIQIIFSGNQQEADAVIQKMIRQDASQNSIHIVSSDREIQNTARDHHARISSSQEFWRELRGQKSEQTSSNESESVRKEQLSKSEVQEWLDIFKKGKPEDHEN
jgi:predicted RNA-binding protein with PIN domain